MTAADDPETIAVPRWAVLALFSGRMCGVCLGHSPRWDGHDRNPPCEGAAREALGKALLEAPA